MSWKKTSNKKDLLGTKQISTDSLYVFLDHKYHWLSTETREVYLFPSSLSCFLPTVWDITIYNPLPCLIIEGNPNCLPQNYNNHCFKLSA